VRALIVLGMVLGVTSVASLCALAGAAAGAAIPLLHHHLTVNVRRARPAPRRRIPTAVPRNLA
jgi:hypothetical protein